MRIELKKWQADMLKDFFEQVPEYLLKILEEMIVVITYGDLVTGNGRYDQGKVEISPAIRHPRLLIERTLHECGHGIEEWLGQNGYSLHSCNSEHVADGFALSLLYPTILLEPELNKIRKIYAESLFPEHFPAIDTETLIDKYVRNSEKIIKESLVKQGVKISRLLRELFEQQKDGFLRRYSSAFVSSNK